MQILHFMDWLRCIMFLHRWTADNQKLWDRGLCGRSKPWFYWRLLWKSVVYRRSCKLDEMGWILQIKRVFLCAERRPETSYTVGSAYTKKKLANKIRPLAEAGNESKCRFVYALHPFPQGNHLRFDDNYELIWRNFRQNSNRWSIRRTSDRNPCRRLLESGRTEWSTSVKRYDCMAWRGEKAVSW